MCVRFLPCFSPPSLSLFRSRAGGLTSRITEFSRGIGAADRFLEMTTRSWKPPPPSPSSSTSSVSSFSSSSQSPPPQLPSVISTTATAAATTAEPTAILEFRNVVFSYPARPSGFILNGLSLPLSLSSCMCFLSPIYILSHAGLSTTIQRHKTYVVIAPSGSGKSTLFALIERFYDCSAGEVYVCVHAVAIRKLPHRCVAVYVRFCSTGRRSSRSLLRRCGSGSGLCRRIRC